MFCTVSVTATGSPSVRDVGEASIVHVRAASAATGPPAGSRARAQSPGERRADATRGDAGSCDAPPRRPELAGHRDPGQRRIGRRLDALDERRHQPLVRAACRRHRRAARAPRGRRAPCDTGASSSSRRTRRRRRGCGRSAGCPRPRARGGSRRRPSARGDGGCRRGSVDVGQVADDQVAQRDVLLDRLELVGGEPAGLAQDRVRDADLADVVEQPRDVDRPERPSSSPSRRPRKTP